MGNVAVKKKYRVEPDVQLLTPNSIPVFNERPPGEDGPIYENPLVKETKIYLRARTNESVAAARVRLEMLENVTLNIAITGESGVGKSTFVNAIRGLRDTDRGAAPTGVVETTFKAIRYSHPTMSNVNIWDLPGIGTPHFKAKKYLQDVHFNAFDVFFIISGNRFKENDVLLAKEIQKRKKLFYFVRSKIDCDIQSESEKPNFNEAQILHKIYMNCLGHLCELGNPPVFLISTKELGKYDFGKLVDSLERSLPEHKRYAVIQSMPVCSLAMIEKKRKTLYRKACAVAAGVSVTGAIAVPGLSVGVGFGAQLRFLQEAHTAFGLDELSLRRLAERMNKTEYEFSSVMTSIFSRGVTDDVLGDMYKEESMIAVKTVESVFSGIAGCGSLVAMGLSFATSLHILNKGIHVMAEDARAVINVAFNNLT